MVEFKNYLRQNTSLSQDEIAHIAAKATCKTLRRNDFLLREGEVCRHKIFIETGLLRIFGTTPDGGEHILQFSSELQWTLDAESYDQQSPAKFNIDAVEPSRIVMWAKHDFDSLLSEIPALQSYAQQLISRNIYMSRQRLLRTLSASPEEKYDDFVRDFPGLLQRLPLRMIASYLGVSLKTLNRVRHDQVMRS